MIRNKSMTTHPSIQTGENANHFDIEQGMQMFAQNIRVKIPFLNRSQRVKLKLFHHSKHSMSPPETISVIHGRPSLIMGNNSPAFVC